MCYEMICMDEDKRVKHNDVIKNILTDEKSIPEWVHSYVLLYIYIIIYITHKSSLMV